jgi:hypothetical protein
MQLPLLHSTYDEKQFLRNFAVKKPFQIKLHATEIIYELCGSTKMQKVNQEVAYQENGQKGKSETA